MSDTSNGESVTAEDELTNPNKRDNEKKRRDQENLYLEELSQLISVNLPEISDSDDSSGTVDPRTEKGSILKETVKRLREIRTDQFGVNQGPVSANQPILPKEILGSLVLEALDGFMFIVRSNGQVDFVSENVSEFLGFSQENITDQSIYSFIHIGDHARFSVNLQTESWRSWKRLSGECGSKEIKNLDRSNLFNIRFRLKSIKTESSKNKNDTFENMQVSAIVMLTPDKLNKDKSALLCIARRLASNESCSETPVESFTTQLELETWCVSTVDTSGLPEKYVEVIGPHFIGKQLTDIVHPQDAPLLNVHLQMLRCEGSHVSRVYRMQLPPPHYTVHVKSKSKIFKGEPSTKGFVMSTHHIVRESDIKKEELPALRMDFPSSVASPEPPRINTASYGSTPKLPQAPPDHEIVIKKMLPIAFEDESVGIDLASFLRGETEVFTPLLNSATRQLQENQRYPSSSSKPSPALMRSISSPTSTQHVPTPSTGYETISPSSLSQAVSSSTSSRLSFGTQERIRPGLPPASLANLSVIPAPSPRPVYLHSTTSMRPIATHQGSSPGGETNPLQTVMLSPFKSETTEAQKSGQLPSTLSYTNQASYSTIQSNKATFPSNPQGSYPSKPPTSGQLASVSYTSNQPTSLSFSQPQSTSSFLTNNPTIKQFQTISSPTSNPYTASNATPMRPYGSPNPPVPRPYTSPNPPAPRPYISPNSPMSAAYSSSISSGSGKNEILTSLLSSNNSNLRTSPGLQARNPLPQKSNQLLKELLTSKENVSRPIPIENISLRQLLNGKSDKPQQSESELLRRLNEPAKDPGSKSKLTELSKLLEARSASKRLSALDEGPPPKIPALNEGPSKGSASLESLLRKEPAPGHISGPPPKWSEIPNKSLPRAEVINRFRDLQNRNNNSGNGGGKPGGKPGAPGGILAAKLLSPLNSGKEVSMADKESPSTQDISELFDGLNWPELERIMGPDILSSMDTELIGDQQEAHISAIELQLKQEIERSIQINNAANSHQNQVRGVHQQVIAQRSSVGNLISDQLQLPLQQHSQLGHQQPLQGHPQLLQGQAGGRQQLRTGTPQQKILIQRSGGTSMDEMMKGVPPNVTMLPSLDNTDSGSHPVRHLSGDPNYARAGSPLSPFGRNSPALSRVGRHTSGDGVQGYQAAQRNVRHASGDQLQQTGNLNHQMRRLSGDSVFSGRRLEPPQSFSAQQLNRNNLPVARKSSVGASSTIGSNAMGTIRTIGSSSLETIGSSPFGTSSSIGSSTMVTIGSSSMMTIGSSSMGTIGSNSIGSISMGTIGSSNLGTIGTTSMGTMGSSQFGTSVSSAIGTIGSTTIGTVSGGFRNYEVPSGRSLSQEDLESFGLSIEVTADEFFLPGNNFSVAAPSPAPSPVYSSGELFNKTVQSVQSVQQFNPTSSANFLQPTQFQSFTVNSSANQLNGPGNHLTVSSNQLTGPGNQLTGSSNQLTGSSNQLTGSIKTSSNFPSETVTRFAGPRSTLGSSRLQLGSSASVGQNSPRLISSQGSRFSRDSIPGNQFSPPPQPVGASPTYARTSRVINQGQIIQTTQGNMIQTSQGQLIQGQILQNSQGQFILQQDGGQGNLVLQQGRGQNQLILQQGGGQQQLVLQGRGQQQQQLFINPGGRTLGTGHGLPSPGPGPPGQILQGPGP